MPAWQRPDWTDPKAHQEALADLPLSQWRWQWIRRHADYERDFRDLPAIETHDVLESTDGQILYMTTRLKRAAGTREKYGLEWLLDPAVDWAPPAVTGRPTVEMHLPIDQTRLQGQQDDGYAILAVDLTRTWEDIVAALKPQMIEEKAAREIAEPGRQRKEGITYIRIIDARAAGATFQAIAEHLAKEGDNSVDENVVRRWHARALEEQEAAIARLKK